MEPEMTSNAAAVEASSEAPIYELTLNVLGYEDGEWVALALEMDLRGYGPTFQDAVRELTDLVKTQVSFAHFKGQPEMVLKPAEPVWWERYAEVRRDRLDSLIRETSRPATGFEIAEIRLPPASPGTSFSQLDA
jgi:hypothetical protein